MIVGMNSAVAVAFSGGDRPHSGNKLQQFSNRRDIVRMTLSGKLDDSMKERIRKGKSRVTSTIRDSKL
jgi:hypothetical protein